MVLSSLSLLVGCKYSNILWLYDGAPYKTNGLQPQINWPTLLTMGLHSVSNWLRTNWTGKGPPEGDRNHWRWPRLFRWRCNRWPHQGAKALRMAALSLRSSLGFSLCHPKDPPRNKYYWDLPSFRNVLGFPRGHSRGGHRCCFPNIFYINHQLKEKMQGNYPDRGLSIQIYYTT